MKIVSSLRRQRAEVFKKMEDRVAKAEAENNGAGRAFTAEEETAHAEDSTALKSLDVRITRALDMEAQQAAAAVALDDAVEDVVDAGIRRVTASVRARAEDRPKGYNFAAYIFASAGAELTRVKGHDRFGGKKIISPAQFAAEVMRDEYVATLHTGTIASGGGLIIQQISGDFIELLRATSVVRAAGAQIVDMPVGNLTLNRQDGATTFTWVGEQSGPNASAPTLGQINLMAKKGQITCPISNDLIRYAGERSVSLALNDMRLVTALEEDLKFLRGVGSAFAPKGLLNWALAANKFNAQGTADLTKVTSDSGTLMLKLEELNVPDDGSWRLFFAPRTRIYLANQRNADGVKAWPEIEQSKTFRALPYLSTTQIPKNLGGASNESEIYLARMNDVVVGQGPMVPEEISSEASYNNSSGTLVSAFQRDETVVKLTHIVDLAVRHAESVAVMQAVIWVP
jgi:HK97 family phage major capsid protein